MHKLHWVKAYSIQLRIGGKEVGYANVTEDPFDGLITEAVYQGAINYDKNPFVLFIDIVMVKPEYRRRGYGTEIIKQIIEVYKTDHNDRCIAIKLQPSAIGYGVWEDVIEKFTQKRTKKLIEWYKSFGFEDDDDQYMFMYLNSSYNTQNDLIQSTSQ